MIPPIIGDNVSYNYCNEPHNQKVPYYEEQCSSATALGGLAFEHPWVCALLEICWCENKHLSGISGMFSHGG